MPSLNDLILSDKNSRDQFISAIIDANIEVDFFLRRTPDALTELELLMIYINESTIPETEKSAFIDSLFEKISIHKIIPDLNNGKWASIFVSLYQKHPEIAQRLISRLISSNLRSSLAPEIKENYPLIILEFFNQLFGEETQNNDKSFFTSTINLFFANKNNITTISDMSLSKNDTSYRKETPIHALIVFSQFLQNFSQCQFDQTIEEERSQLVIKRDQAIVSSCAKPEYGYVEFKTHLLLFVHVYPLLDATGKEKFLNAMNDGLWSYRWRGEYRIWGVEKIMLDTPQLSWAMAVALCETKWSTKIHYGFWHDLRYFKNSAGVRQFAKDLEFIEEHYVSAEESAGEWLNGDKNAGYLWQTKTRTRLNEHAKNYPNSKLGKALLPDMLQPRVFPEPTPTAPPASLVMSSTITEVVPELTTRQQSNETCFLGVPVFTRPEANFNYAAATVYQPTFYVLPPDVCNIQNPIHSWPTVPDKKIAINSDTPQQKIAAVAL